MELRMSATISPLDIGINQTTLDSLNVEQAKHENKAHLEDLGGVEGLTNMLAVNLEFGLTHEQALMLKNKFGDNCFPDSPLDSYFTLLFQALSDATLLILIAAAAVSLAIGVISNPQSGWIEGTAIFIAVFLVSNISAGNDYSKQIQFRALETSSALDERTSVLRDGVILRLNPKELVVGDIIVLQAGDQIPADCIILGTNTIYSNEASLTGEPEDLPKNGSGDCFLLSSCVITEGEDCRAIVIGVGINSQWGKIKANLVAESVNTPLQDKLEDMTQLIGYIGMVAALGTMLALVISIWARNGGRNILKGFIDAFIMAVTIVVVAIPEGLPLAVTISLAYSTKKMYKDQCFIRVLAACETMGNATNICSDKTGTLTENRMTVVSGWFADTFHNQEEFAKGNILDACKRICVEQISLNRTAYLVHRDSEGKLLDVPNVIGNKTEGALILMIKSWDYSYEEVKEALFDENRDRVFGFNSKKKRSSVVLHRTDGSVRIYCKGASEWILNDCTMYMDSKGNAHPMTPTKRAELDAIILQMAQQALRTLLLAHRDFSHASHLPVNWRDNPPDQSELCVDCIAGIIDPLRPDVTEAVATAKRAGVIVRMVTGDNIATAAAIAKQCGILTADGITIEGPAFRKLSPREADDVLCRLQVMARSSPDDKFLLVTRLNGNRIPANREEWEAKYKDKPDISWENDRDRLLPGYLQEWEATRPEGGEVVGVTGDGTNDAPALKAADVGLSMGITGTKVAQSASDIVILDDRFSSIVRAIMWGRAVYDNIRKFLQFQLTVNIVALLLVFMGAAVGFGEPLNAVQMLWVNLVMDTLGALALGTEAPTMTLLERRPYKRNASLISWPMWRNIAVQGSFQLSLLFLLMFAGPKLFHVHEGISCFLYTASNSRATAWEVAPILSSHQSRPDDEFIYCSSFAEYCHEPTRDCFEAHHMLPYWNNVTKTTMDAPFSFANLASFENTCLTCVHNDYTHGTIIFNTFIFCQVFNEYTSRSLFDDVNVFKGLTSNLTFLGVSVFTICCQIFLIELGGNFVKTTPLNLMQWLITIALGFIGVPLGMLMRFIPVKEDPNSFFVHSYETREERKLLLTGSSKKVVDASSSSSSSGGLESGGGGAALDATERTRLVSEMELSSHKPSFEIHS